MIQKVKKFIGKTVENYTDSIAEWISIVDQGANGEAFEILNSNKDETQVSKIHFTNMSLAEAKEHMDTRNYAEYDLVQEVDNSISAVSKLEFDNSYEPREIQLNENIKVTIMTKVDNNSEPTFNKVSDVLGVIPKDRIDNFMGWVAYEDMSLTDMSKAFTKANEDSMPLGVMDLLFLYRDVVDNLIINGEYNKIEQAGKVFADMAEQYRDMSNKFKAEEVDNNGGLQVAEEIKNSSTEQEEIQTQEETTQEQENVDNEAATEEAATQEESTETVDNAPIGLPSTGTMVGADGHANLVPDDDASEVLTLPKKTIDDLFGAVESIQAQIKELKGTMTMNFASKTEVAEAVGEVYSKVESVDNSLSAVSSVKTFEANDEPAKKEDEKPADLSGLRLF